MRRGTALFGAWLLLAAFGQPTADSRGDERAEGAAADPLAAPATTPPEPGEQYPPRLADETVSNTPEPPRRPAAQRPQWRLTVDMSVVFDDNVTNSTDRETIDIDLGGGVLPVPLDPSLRQHGGIGAGFSAALGGRVPVVRDVAAAVDVEGYVLEQEGRLGDDASLLVAAGAEIGGGRGATLLVQAIGFERRYAGVSAMRGIGLRGRYRQPMGAGQALSLFVDARFFDSDYGEDFGGTEAGAYLSYEAVIDPTLSASAGLYARASWLGAEEWSNREFGAYGGLNHYLSRDFVGGVSAGISRAAFDGPTPTLSPDPRRDWRLYGSLYVAMRRPLLFGLTPSTTYTYNRTGSSILFYRADRHRLRFGLTRTF